MELVIWPVLGVLSWALYKFLRSRFPDFYARSEAWSAQHPWLNAAIFGVVGTVMSFVTLLVRGESGTKLAAGTVGFGGSIFLLFLWMSLSYSKKYRDSRPRPD